MKKLSNHLKINKSDILGKWNSRIVFSHAKCLYCLKIKSDYIDSETGKLTPLQCECEKYFQNLLEIKEKVIQTQTNIKIKTGYNEKKISEADKIYLMDSEKMFSRINETIRQMLQRKNNNMAGSVAANNTLNQF